MSLPAPYYDRDGITIYHGDCREVLTAFPHAELLLTDPPYGHGDRWKGGTWAANPIYDAALIWDQQPAALELLTAWIQQATRAVVWGGNYFGLPPSRCWLAWEKSSKMPTLADFELAWTNLDRPSKLWREDRNADGKRDHPTQKPLSLMRWCLDFVGGTGLILDPYMGSGTTLRAAKDARRPAIGIEIEERYCEIAARRLAQGVLPFKEN